MLNRLAYLLQSVAEETADAFVFHALGVEYFALQNIEEAEKWFAHTIQFDKNSVGTYYHLANAQWQLQKVDQAFLTIEAGKIVAKTLENKHALAELQRLQAEIEWDAE